MHAEDRIRLQHMVEAAQSAIQFVSGRVRADLDSDRMLLFAVIRAIEIMGEAASRISDETRAGHEAIPWKAVIGMRNRLIHAYFEVNTQIVWETVSVEIPGVLPHLQTLIASK